MTFCGPAMIAPPFASNMKSVPVCIQDLRELDHDHPSRGAADEALGKTETAAFR
jgi:hypothetical protein